MVRILSRRCLWVVAVLFFPLIGCTDERPSTATVPADLRFAPIRQQIADRVESGGIPSFAIGVALQPDGDIHVLLGDQYEVLLNGVSRSQGVLRGEFPGIMSVDEEPEHDHAILVYLKPWSGRLIGFFEANYEDERGAYALPNLVWLERAPSPQPTQ